jgi:REP element-mobilizing transposase RayT
MCYYHLMNRVAGEPGYFPFGDVEKEKLFRLAVGLSRFYSLELLSVVVMGNHYHIVCAAPAEAPSREEVAANWRAFHGKQPVEPNWDDPETVAHLAARMRDISCFVKDLQQRFTCWFNRTRRKRRRGGLWADRFRNTILEKDTALWDCLTYVEMNPVRARLAQSPGDYRFCTWGRMVGGGRHPFAANLVRHLRRHLGEQAKRWSNRRVVAELAANMARIAAGERGEDSATIFAEEEAARSSRDRFTVTARRRVRYWTDGVVIGSELFVRDVAAKLFDAKRALKKRLARGTPADSGEAVFAYRRLNPAL